MKIRNTKTKTLHTCATCENCIDVRDELLLCSKKPTEYTQLTAISRKCYQKQVAPSEFDEQTSHRPSVARNNERKKQRTTDKYLKILEQYKIDYQNNEFSPNNPKQKREMSFLSSKFPSKVKRELREHLTSNGNYSIKSVYKIIDTNVDNSL